MPHPRSVPHLYAEEIARAFWDPDMELKQDWDPTLEVFEVKEKLTDMAYVAHLTFKPFWPTTQRDCVLCCEMVPLVNDGWAVCNQSVDHPDRRPCNRPGTAAPRRRYVGAEGRLNRHP